MKLIFVRKCYFGVSRVPNMCTERVPNMICSSKKVIIMDSTSTKFVLDILTNEIMRRYDANQSGIWKRQIHTNIVTK